MPAKFNKESADDAILTVNLLGAMQTLVGKDGGNDCNRKDEMRGGLRLAGEDLREEGRDARGVKGHKMKSSEPPPP